MTINIPMRYEKATWTDVPDQMKSMVLDMYNTRKGIYIHGGVGSGKTHMAYAIAKHLSKIGKKVSVHSTADLIADIKQDIEREGYSKKRWEEKLSNFNGVVIFDDIGAERITEYVAEMFYLIINRRYNQMLPVIFTSNFTLGQLSQRIGDRTASRIAEMCNIFKLDGDDRRVRKS